MLASTVAAVPNPHSEISSHSHSHLFSHSRRQQQNKLHHSSNPSSFPLLTTKRSLKRNSTERRPRSDTFSNSMCTINYKQVSTDFKSLFRNGNYAQAANVAITAQKYAQTMKHLAIAQKYQNAYQLAKQYQHLQNQMIQNKWQIGVQPIFEPDDPASTEARSNMICQPDHPTQQISESSSQRSIQDELTTQSNETNQNQQIVTSNRNIQQTSSISNSKQQKCKQETTTTDHESNYFICCFKMSWLSLSRRGR